MLEAREQLVAARVVVPLAGLLGRLAVHRAPAGLEQHAPARAEDVLARDGRLDARALEDGLRVEDGEEAADDEVVDLLLVVAPLARVDPGLRRHDRVVVGDLRVDDDARQRQLTQAEDVAGRLRVLGQRSDERDGRADLLDQLARQVARARARIGDRLPLLVELLRRAERPARREAEERVRVPLEGGEVVEELGLLALLLLLQLRDLAVAAGAGLDDCLRIRLGRQALAAEVAAAIEPLSGRRERTFDEPVRLGLERSDLLLAPRHERERGRLHSAERDGAVERRAQTDRRRARRVHADEPVSLGAGARRRLERLHLLARPEPVERVLDRLLRHRVEPEALDGLVDT